MWSTMTSHRRRISKGGSPLQHYGKPRIDIANYVAHQKSTLNCPSRYEKRASRSRSLSGINHMV